MALGPISGARGALATGSLVPLSPHPHTVAESRRARHAGPPQGDDDRASLDAGGASREHPGPVRFPERLRPYLGPAAGVLLVLAFAAPKQQACFALDAAPVAPGYVLAYTVEETAGTARKVWPLRAVVLRGPEGLLGLEFRGAPGEVVTFTVDDRLRPVEPGEILEFTLSSGHRLRPALLWLAPEDRRVAAMTPAGRVQDLEVLDGLVVWTVHGEDGGARHYEEETGLLSSFDVTVEGTRVRGQRVLGE